VRVAGYFNDGKIEDTEKEGFFTDKKSKLLTALLHLHTYKDQNMKLKRKLRVSIPTVSMIERSGQISNWNYIGIKTHSLPNKCSGPNLHPGKGCRLAIGISQQLRRPGGG